MLVLSLGVGVLGASSQAFADGCYLCGSGSANSCAQCRYGAKDTADARKSCEKRGCKIGGTASCSTAANVKVCRVEPPTQTQPVIAWCAP